MFGEGDLGPLHIQELWQKNSEIYDQYLHWSCILVIAPSVYIELPLGSSRRELNLLVMRFKLHVHKGAMTKKFRSLQAIFVFQFAF